jgi:hypothetical protein
MILVVHYALCGILATIPRMDPDDAETHEMLKLAREKGEKLLADLLKKQDELDANPPTDLPPEKLQQGREAMQNAIASTRRMLDSLGDAQKIASLHTN